MMAVSGELPHDDDRWAFEPKWDGMRAIVGIDHGIVRARSRTDKDLHQSFPELSDLAELCDAAILDGEIVAFDDAGRPSFSRLQQRIGVVGDLAVATKAAATPVIYIVFDLLRLGDLDVGPLRFDQRRRLLEQLVEPGPTWRLSPCSVGGGEDWLQTARDQQLEGVMAKRIDSPYRPGRRSTAWRKIKIRHAQEFVVCGWTPGTGHRSTAVGALILGCHPGADSRLRWAGNVGTGFSDTDLGWWRGALEESACEMSPFDPPPRHLALREARWVHPRHVVQVAYAEWTGDLRLRHPSMLGRRDDVEVDQVRCEE